MTIITRMVISVPVETCSKEVFLITIERFTPWYYGVSEKEEGS